MFFLAWTQSAFLRGPSPLFGGDQAHMGLSSGALKTGMCSGCPPPLPSPPFLRGPSPFFGGNQARKNAISPFFGASGNKNIGATIRIGREFQCLPYWTPKIGKNSIIGPFLSKALDEDGNPLQELKVCPHSRPYLLVYIIKSLILCML